MSCLRIISQTLHSIFAKHSTIKGALTNLPGAAVRLKLANLSVSIPEHVPIPMTWSSRSIVEWK